MSIAKPAARVALPDDHPGFSDHAYRHRRDEIAAGAAGYRSGEQLPEIHYTDEEHALWRLVSGELAAKHRRNACAEYLAAVDRLALAHESVPQLQDVSERLRDLTGFRIEPVPGLVSTRTFYGALADRCFLSTQYIRHHSVPFYTPEPDVVHELVGHCNMLSSPVFARLHELAGQASVQAHSAEALEFFSRVFWFTLEFGVVWEDGDLRAYGAGLLSSYGELDAFRAADIRPFDIASMGTLAYDITRYQPILFGARSIEQVADELTHFFSTYDDEVYHRLRTAVVE